MSRGRSYVTLEEAVRRVMAAEGMSEREAQAELVRLLQRGEIDLWTLAPAPGKLHLKVDKAEK